MNFFALFLPRPPRVLAAVSTLALFFAALFSPALPASAASAASSAQYIESCSWDRPGHNPYSGDVASAVDRYPDLAPDVRERLRARMEKRDYDDVVTIERDRIVGSARYGTTIRDMHFGANKVCRSVTRAGWRPGMEERGLVYCDSGECLLVPTVCRNVSRITRAEVSPDSALGDEEPLLALATPPDGLGQVAPIALLDSAPTFEARSNPPDAVGAGGPAGGGGNGGGGGFPGVPGLPSGPGPGGGTFVPPGNGANPPPPTLPPAPVTPIPEPETIVLMLAGLAVVAGVAARRRRRG